MKFLKKLNISISIQISIFLIIIAFVPVAGVMALKTYEKQLLEQIENSNVQQARLVASSLYGSHFTKENANGLLKAMNGRFDARIRVLNTDLELIADSAVTFSQEPVIEDRTETQNRISEKIEKRADETFVYRLFSFPVRLYRKYFRPPVQSKSDYYSVHSVYDGNEIKAALNGRYGAATRISKGGQNSVNLYSAVPVFNGNEVCGVVLVSRSTYKILSNLYKLRLDLGKVFLWSLLAVAVIAVFLSFRISLPLKKLSKQTALCADRKGRIISTEFTGNLRNDEIGELSRSFTNLVDRLQNRIKFTESFASDVSHEFKNPLAAIRSCTEILNTDISAEEKKEFITAINEEIDRLQKLLTGVRNITKIDGEIEFDKVTVDAGELCENLIKQAALINKDVKYSFNNKLPESFKITIGENYLERILDNLLSNAAGFGTEVILKTNCDSNCLVLQVEDNGPGVKEEERNKIFERFYTNRSEDQKTQHTGLGLATVKAISEAMNGSVSVGKSSELGGALFTVRLPL